MEGQRPQSVNPEPRQREEYSDRQVEAARRVLIDIGQVLASFADSMVVIGGWVPDLLLSDAEEPHIGSIDVDLALDASKLDEGRYAELLNLLLRTKRYECGAKDFQLVVKVDLEDGERPVQVDVEFLAPKEVKLRKNKPKFLEGFRILQTEGCGEAFRAPVEQVLSGQNVRGAENKVRLLVASLADFLVLKALAIGGRDKPKDTYDFCYTLENLPGGMEPLAKDWTARLGEKNVARAVEILREKFASVRSFGPQQMVEFHNSVDKQEQEMQARRAYELVQRLSSLIG
jgi:hypothetical protein